MKSNAVYFTGIILLAHCLFSTAARAQSPPLFTLTQEQDFLEIKQDMVYWYVDKTRSTGLENIREKNFYPFPVKDFLTVEAGWSFFSTFKVINKSGRDKEYVLQLPKTGRAFVLVTGPDSPEQKLQTGSLFKLRDRSVTSNIDAVKFLLPKNSVTDLIIHFQPVYSLYIPKNFTLHLQELAAFTQTGAKRLLWQGIFLGVIMVMALYNLIIFIAVKDTSYFYYVLSILSIGMYFTFYYGFGIEYLWPAQPMWDTWCYTLIVPFTAIARLLFTRTYLHTPQQLPLVNKVMNILLFACSFNLVLGFVIFIYRIDLLKPFIEVLGVLGTLVLVIMLVAGFSSYLQNRYKPALYFIAANLILIVGAIAFILREMNFLQDNFFTRYVVQIGVLVQVVVFALGLASRYNETKFQLVKETLERERITLEKEREKKELIKKQKEELQLQVAKQTADLKKQNINLEESREKLSRLNDVKDKLFSIISHDLRNPLATMQSYLKLLSGHQEKLSGEEKQRLMKEAQESADNMNQLLYNLLQWSKSQMNLLTFSPEIISMKPALDKNIRLLQPYANLKKINIQNCPNGEIFVLADKDMLDFILRNLLSNAIKFSHKNSAVKIEMIPDSETVTIKISDEGIGLSEEELEQVIHAKGAISRRGTSKEKGTGLGLMICKEFIEKNNGKLVVESELGKGSVFGFTVKGYAPNPDGG
ncbi:MAG: sensor histidine kinase [Ferruginibacter sp.]|nr:sensor histidine kinase [Ferruginibacter sp.]